MNRLVRGELLEKALEKSVERNGDEGVEVGCTKSSCDFTLRTKILATWSNEERETYKAFQVSKNVLYILKGMSALSYAE